MTARLPTETLTLPTGAEARRTGPQGRLAVICVNGGTGRERPGDWSATIEWLVRNTAASFSTLTFVEVRYRVKSWRRLAWCTEDALAAVNHVLSSGARECALLGFSMGGAVAIDAARHDAVSCVIGLAPWIPDRLDVDGVAGKRMAVLHGALDRWLPGVPGVSPKQTQRGLERVRDAGADASFTLIPGAVHGVAVRAPWGGLVRLPRASRWRGLLADELTRFGGQQGDRGGAEARRPG